MLNTTRLIKRASLLAFLAFAALPARAARLAGGGGSGGGGITTISTNTTGANSFIWNQNILQSGATFYTSSGTVKGEFYAGTTGNSSYNLKLPSFNSDNAQLGFIDGTGAHGGFQVLNGGSLQMIVDDAGETTYSYVATLPSYAEIKHLSGGSARFDSTGITATGSAFTFNAKNVCLQDGTNCPSISAGSTNYIQNTLTPTTTTQAFSVQYAVVNGSGTFTGPVRAIGAVSESADTGNPGTYLGLAGGTYRVIFKDTSSNVAQIDQSADTMRHIVNGTTRMTVGVNGGAGGGVAFEKCVMGTSDITFTDGFIRNLILTNNTSVKGQVVRGLSGQSAPLLEMQNSGSVALSSFTPNGDLNISSIAVTNQINFNSDGTVYKIAHTGNSLRLTGGNSGGGADMDSNGFFVPQADSSQDLGTDSLRWRTLKALAWTAGNGSIQFPSINFANNTGMGFLSLANQTISLSLANAHTIQWIDSGGAPSTKTFNYFSRTTTQDRGVAQDVFSFSDGTDATRKGRRAFSVVDTSTRTAMQMDTDGSNAYTQLFGSTTFHGQVVVSSAVFDGSTSAGTSGQVLTSNGAGSAPTWQASASAAVYTSTYIYVASKNAGATTVWMTLSTVTVAAGTWTITGQVSLTTAGAVQDFVIAISTISGSITTDHIDGDNQMPGSFLSGLGDGAGVISDYEVKPTVQTSYYLKQKVNWTISTPSSSSRIHAEKK